MGSAGAGGERYLAAGETDCDNAELAGLGFGEVLGNNRHNGGMCSEDEVR